jgi:iron complex transport system substrate-binding protein
MSRIAPEVAPASTAVPPRIVSLLASGTELVCALGLGEHLVGRSHECDDPEWVKTLPAVSAPTFDVTGTSRDIDERVRRLLHAGQPLYAVDDALLDSLSPDVVITQTHCEVCAVSPADLAHGARAGRRRERVLSLAASTLDTILDDFVNVARLLGCEERGVALVESIRAGTASLGAKIGGLPRPRVVCLEWVDPFFSMGNWGPELVALAGGENLLGVAGAHSTTTPWSDIVLADPDVLVVAPCGYGLERALAEMPGVAAQPGFENLAAVRNDRVFVADGNVYFNRSGPKVFESAELLAEMFHPGAVPPAHEGAWWRRWRAG